MKHNKKFLFLLAIVLSHGSLKAQSIEPSTINAGGFYFANNAIELDASIGEMTLVSTKNTANLIVTQGLLQPDANIPDNIRENYFTKHIVRVFPNPSQSVVNVTAHAERAGTISYSLTDILGKTIIATQTQAEVGQNNIEIPMTHHAQGNYMLRITYQSFDKKITGTQNFKIQKIK